MASSKWIIVGISGITCGGKTSLAEKIKEKYSGCKILHQDHYFHPEDSPIHVRVPELNHFNHDLLVSLDMIKMHDDVNRIISEKSNNSPNILVVDGFCMLNYKPIADMCDLKYTLTLTKEQCISRRQKRVYPRLDVVGYFDLCVWPAYLMHHAELESQPDVVVMDGALNNLHEKVLEDIRRLLL